MLTDFLPVIARTPSMVLITARPEYEGALTRVPGAQTIALAPFGGEWVYMNQKEVEEFLLIYGTRKQRTV